MTGVTGFTLLRRIRGTLGISALWAGAFSLVGVVSAAVFSASALAGVIPGVPTQALAFSAVAAILRWAVIGALSGVVFSVTIMIAERSRTLATLSPHRFTRWGTLAGAVGAGLVAAAFAAMLLASSTAVLGGLALLKGLIAVPLVGGALGRRTARLTLRAAQRDERTLGTTGRLSVDGGASATPPVLPRAR